MSHFMGINHKKESDMFRINKALIVLSVLLVVLITYGKVSFAESPGKVDFTTYKNAKKPYDDASPIYKILSFDKILPPDVYEKITYDIDKMKDKWAEAVGFRAPEKTGKIAPEIKPGKYNYQDKEKYPGLKKLMIPRFYEMFNPGQPPFVGNFPEMEIVPTKQYYYALPIAEATEKNIGKVKSDPQGYLDTETYEAGLPFPRPSGPHKALQIMENWDKRYYDVTENSKLLSYLRGFDKNLKEDFIGNNPTTVLRLGGRVQLPPYGFIDERARKMMEKRTFLLRQLAPRDLYGNVILSTEYYGAGDFNQFLLYVAMLRRVRKMSGTDTQDIGAGTDWIFEDAQGFSQKLSPNRYPYRYTVLEEREFLAPSYTEDGEEYFSKEGVEYRKIKFQRRPIYVLELEQQDKSFVYGKRIIYMDAETFIPYIIENYDQKGNLYRVSFNFNAFFPKMGNFCYFNQIAQDHQDYHNTILMYNYQYPVPDMSRADVSMRAIIKKGK